MRSLPSAAPISLTSFLALAACAAEPVGSLSPSPDASTPCTPLRGVLPLTAARWTPSVCGDESAASLAGRAVIEVGARCDGSAALVLQDVSTGSSALVALDAAGNTWRMSNTRVQWIVGTPRGWIAALATGGRSGQIIPLELPDSRTVPLPGRLLPFRPHGLAAHASGTVAVLGCDDVTRCALYAYDATPTALDEGPVVLDGDALMEPPVTTRAGFAVLTRRWVGDGADPSAYRVRVHRFGARGGAMGAAAAWRVPFEPKALVERPADLLLLGVDGDQRVRAAVLGDGGTVRLLDALGDARNRTRAPLDLRAAREGDGTVVTWTNADPDTAADGDAVPVVYVGDDGRVEARCGPRGGRYDGAFVASSPGGAIRVWNEWAPGDGMGRASVAVRIGRAHAP